MIKKEILQDLDGDDLTSPPCWIMTRLPPSAPSRPEAALMPDQGPGEVSATATAPPPALPEVVELPFGQAPIPVTEASGQHVQDPAPAEPPKLYPPLLVSTDKKGREMLELSRDCAPPESRGEGKRTDKRLTVQAAALGRSISGPPENLICPRDRTVLQGRPRARYSQTSVPGAELLATGRMNALRQGRKRKLPQLWGLLAWKLTRASGAQRYQVLASPW